MTLSPAEKAGLQGNLIRGLIPHEAQRIEQLRRMVEAMEAKNETQTWAYQRALADLDEATDDIAVLRSTYARASARGFR
jgi:hypothetical protein